MTREIALHCMKSYSELHSDLCELCPIYGQTGSDHCFEDALQYVIGMLEQEPVIDKIRSEIEQARDKLKKIPYDTGSDRNNAFIDNVLSANVEFCNDLLQILDKYKGEIEEEE